MARHFSTVIEFINFGKVNANAFGAGVIEFEGFNSIGDGGASRWQRTGVTGLTPSRTPTNLDANEFTDAVGDKWELIPSQIITFNGVQFLPSPFGDSGNGGYYFNGTEFVFLASAADEAAAAAASAAAAQVSAQRAEDAAASIEGQLTTTQLIASSLTLDVGDTIQTNGFYTAGDGGGALWVKTANTDTPSQTPAQLGDAKLADSTGSVWELSNLRFSALDVGYLVGDDFSEYMSVILSANNNGKTFIFENIDHSISNTINIQGGFKCETMTDSTITPNDGFLGDGVIIESDYSSAITLPRITDFTEGAGITLYGSNLADIKINRIARCKSAIKLKTTSDAFDNSKLLDSRIDVMFIATCENAILWESDSHENVMQGNEVYVNFITQTSNACIFKETTPHTQQADWDSNKVQVQAFDPIGLDVQRLLVNESSFGVPRLSFKVESWLGGFDGLSPKIIEGEFNQSSIELSPVQQIMKEWIYFNGRQNNIKLKTRMDLANTPVAAENSSNPSGFNSGFHLDRGESLLRLTSIGDMLPGQTTTYYAYHVLLGGQGVNSRGRADGYIDIKQAVIKPYSLSFAAYSNSINVENEIIIRVTNTSNSTIVSGTNFDVFLKVE